jgi:hypothetical protein
MTIALVPDATNQERVQRQPVSVGVLGNIAGANGLIDDLKDVRLVLSILTTVVIFRRMSGDRSTRTLSQVHASRTDTHR